MTLTDRVERYLWRRGFAPGPVRLVARTLIMMSAGLFILGVVLLPLARWPFWLGLGAALSTWNFYSLAFFVQKIFPSVAANTGQARHLMLGQLLRSNLRLFITGILVYISLVRFHANPFALVAGLSLAVLIMPVLLIIRKSGQQ